jgi:amidase
MTEAKYEEAFKSIRLAAKVNSVDKTISDLNLDVIVGPIDGRIPTIAAAAGCPVGTVPLGYSPTNGRPYGLAAVVGAGEEGKMLKFMSARDATMLKRKPPPQMVNWNKKLSPKV